jgi:16S rRNA (guanine527-N7)-methyltransferase
VEPALERLRRYAEALLQWNRDASNIMSRNDEERIVERHLLESIAPAAWLRESGARRWLDFGSGAGFPAIPLAIAGVGDAWTLVESRRSKTLFLIKTLKELGLKDFDVVNDRLENVASDPDRAGAYDGFTSRATMRVGPTLALAAAVVSAGGHAFLWKGSGFHQELDDVPAWRAAWEPGEVRPVGNGPNVVARFTRKTSD